MSKRDPFVTLGLQRSASPTEIKAAYYDLMKVPSRFCSLQHSKSLMKTQRYHPDTAGELESAKVAYANVAEAYELLRDEATRRSLANTGAPSSSFNTPPRYHRPPDPRPPPGYSHPFDPPSGGDDRTRQDYYARVAQAYAERRAARHARPMGSYAEGSTFTGSPPRSGYGLHPDDPRMNHAFYSECVPLNCIHCTTNERTATERPRKRPSIRCVKRVV